MPDKNQAPTNKKGESPTEAASQDQPKLHKLSDNELDQVAGGSRPQEQHNK